MRLAAVLLAALLLTAPAAAARSGPVQRAVAALRQDPVYVDPASDTLSAAQAQTVRRQIRDAGAAPMFVAVLPDSADPAGELRTLRDGLGLPGTYVLVAGHHLRATST